VDFFTSDDDEVLIGSTHVNDDVGKNCFSVQVVAADVVPWRKIEPLRIVMIPVVFTVYVPLREIPAASALRTYA